MSKDAIRQTILDDPAVVLDDKDLVRALLGAETEPQGRNIVDLRGVLIDRLENQLGLLEHTHRDVVAAAYENLAGTHQIHRAVLAIVSPTDFDGFLTAVAEEVVRIMTLDAVRLCFEGDDVIAGEPLGPRDARRNLIVGLPRDGAMAYCGGPGADGGKPVMLRSTTRASGLIFRDQATPILSEAILKLDLGEDKLPGLLVLGSADPSRFNRDQGTDLLAFFGAVFSTVMKKWLS